MAVGFALIGMLVGVLAAAGALVSGGGIGVAFLAYAGGGAVGLLAGALLAMLPHPAPAGVVASQA
jgi:hypothetical protein